MGHPGDHHAWLQEPHGASEGWRYIRYANGDEELYDKSADPLEYVNLALKPEYASRKAELAKWLPKTDAPEPPWAGGEETPKVKKARKKNN